MIQLELNNRDMLYYYNEHIYKTKWLYKLALNFTGDVVVALDQSTTSTGICIFDMFGNLFISEFVRNELPVGRYNRALVDELSLLTMSLNVKFFLYEKHGAHITPLSSVLNTVTDSLKKFSVKFKYRNIECHGIPPAVWRSGFLVGDDYSGRFTRDAVKLACYEQAIKEVPSLEKFYKYSNHDLDGFEAYGIGRGFMNLNFDNSGIRKVNRCLEYSYTRQCNYVLKKIKVVDLDKEVKHLQLNVAKSECPIVMSNNDIQLEEAINRMSGVHKEFILICIRGLEYCRLVLEYGEPIMEDEMFIIHVRR